MPCVQAQFDRFKAVYIQNYSNLERGLKEPIT
jgi:hypothetical protein